MKSLKIIPKGSKMMLFNPRNVERKGNLNNRKKGNYIVQMRYVGETKFRHYGFGFYVSELIKEIKEGSKYCQYRIIDLDTDEIIYFQ